MLKRFLFLVPLFFLPQALVAAEDARLTVEIAGQEERGVRPDLSAAMRQALPLLWDRLIPISERGTAKSLSGTENMISRISPGEEVTQVEFSHQAVFDYLSQTGIAYLATAPSFNLVIKMRNSVGLPMQQTELLLKEHARQTVQRWGIEISSLAPELVFEWQWIDSSQVQLNVLSDTRLPAFSQTRDIGGRDPFEYLQEWIDELLLQARDAYAFVPDPTSVVKGTQETANLTGWLSISRALSLGEQAILEDTLRNDPRVLQLTPHTYSNQGLRYKLTLKGANTSWLADWFNRRDLQIEAVANGWKVE